jgi:hypothetical protein
VRANVADPVTDAKAVKSVVEKFREKYGAKDVKKYYSKFDVAVVLELQSTGLRTKWSYKPKGVCGSDFLKTSHASNPIHISTPPKAATNTSVCADHMLVTNRLPNTDAR